MLSTRNSSGTLLTMTVDIGLIMLSIAAGHLGITLLDESVHTGPAGPADLTAPCLFLVAVTALIQLLYHRLYMAVEFIYPADLFKKTVPACFFSLLFLFALDRLIRPVNLPLHIIGSLPAAFALIFLFRCRLFLGQGANREKILILGITSQAGEIIKASRGKKWVGFDIVGFATSIPGQVGEEAYGKPVLGNMNDLESILEGHPVDTIVVTLRNRRGKLPVQPLLNCKFQNIRILEGTQFYETAQRKLLIDDFFKPSWFIFEQGFYRTSFHSAYKRIQGMVISLLLLAALLPVLLITAWIIKLESPGPILYFQQRIGRNGRPFSLIKFRSMTLGAEPDDRPRFAVEDDPRVTRIGRFMRKIRLDEVPQFVNIFKGDMDLVGPRPERDVFVRELEKMLPYYHLRHAVRPGLTGWAQVNYPYGENFEDSKEKLNYDLYYVKHFSWYLDLQIFVMTVKEVFFGKGR